MNTLQLSLNGRSLAAEPMTLYTLLQRQGYDAKVAFACAVNTVFVPRAQWPFHPLHDGDRIDVITPVTGG